MGLVALMALVGLVGLLFQLAQVILDNPVDLEVLVDREALVGLVGLVGLVDLIFLVELDNLVSLERNQAILEVLEVMKHMISCLLGILFYCVCMLFLDCPVIAPLRSLAHELAYLYIPGA